MRESFNHLAHSALFFVLILVPSVLFPLPDKRPRARDIGLQVGVLQPGRWNAITDVDGVRVGQVTLVQGENVRTGVTAILPHAGNLFQQKVPAAIFVGNGFGKLAGVTQIDELGNIETPVLLTNTLSVPTVADALIEYTLSGRGNETVRSVNPVVGETNDGWLNDIRGRHVTKEHVFEAIKRAESGPVDEGCVGAGTGTICMGFKGGIGTSSRVLPQRLGGYTVGVLVQTNFGGILQMNGAPVGRELGHFAFQDKLKYADGDGSCMIVVATDAPLLSRNLKRLAKRAYLALSKTGAFSSNGSGDYVIAFSTANRVAHEAREATRTVTVLRNEHLSPLFLAAVEATEEAIYNSLLKAETTSGRDGHVVEALPVNKVIEICKKYNVLDWNDVLPPAGQPKP
ncbi:MAG: S58 family peptidase [Calditrichaeota bacterium]|nr:MAG: S58 family peptidase [Calditrichota bacterium]